MALPHRTAKKAYVPPLCESYPISDVSRLQRGGRPSKQIAIDSRTSRKSDLNGPILLVNDPSCKFHDLLSYLRAEGLEYQSLPDSGWGQLIQVLLSTETNPEENRIRILEVAHPSNGNLDRPLKTGVIVTTDSEASAIFDSTHTWRLSGPVDGDLLRRAIQSVYDLGMHGMD